MADKEEETEEPQKVEVKKKFDPKDMLIEGCIIPKAKEIGRASCRERV